MSRSHQIIVLRDHSACAAEETGVEDGPAEGDVERIAHERASCKVETSDICDLAKD
jgi:hypothetical protein